MIWHFSLVCYVSVWLWSRAWNSKLEYTLGHYLWIFSNSQFKFVLKDADRDGFCTTIVSLTTKFLDSWENLKVGFRIYQFKTKKLFDGKFLETKAIADSGDFEYFPQVTRRFRLKPGNYVIIPYTKYCNEESEFLIRIFSEKPSYLQKLL